MDIKDIIASGVVESYVLGLASEQEARAVECLSKIYPEIQEEILRCSETVELFAKHGAIQPPDSIKASILKKISEVEQEQNNTVDFKQTQAFDNNNISSPSSFWKITAVAASLALFVVGGVAILRNNDAIQSETALMDSENEIRSLNAALSDKRILDDFIQNPELKSLVLGGTELVPGAHATLLYTQNENEILLHAAGLPKTREGKQFQLWAIVDGNPVSLGVLERDSLLYKTNLPANIDRSQVQAFAITLEDEGGKESPTLEQLHVIGFLQVSS
jgi:anti-sigma-K factor RskA